MDAIDCMVTNNDLALEGDINKRDDDRKSKSRRDQRSYENSNSRSTRRSPPPPQPPGNRKRPPSPLSSSSSSSRSRNHYTSSSQKHHRNSSPSSPPLISQKHYRNSPPSPPPLPPPPPPSFSSSSRHHQSSRSTASTKRSYSPGDSSRDRRQPTHRSRTDLSSNNILASNSTTEQTKTIPKQEKNDLSLISEDESSRKTDIKNSTAIVQSSPKSTSHNPSSVPNLNESFLETSTIHHEHELSLFANSMISNPNTSLADPASNNFTQTLDHINRYKIISGIKANNSNPQLENWLKEIPLIIQKQIDLQKTELNVREREIKLREREIAEKEKLFNTKPIETTTITESIKITIPEERTPVKSENNIHRDIVNISPEESVVKTIPSITENSNPTTITRKTGGKSRFSPIDIDPTFSSSNENPAAAAVELQSIDANGNQSSKKASTQENLSTDEPILPPYATELKVTSSSTSRKVEIQTGNHESNVTKSSSQDLRLTLSKNRSKYPSNGDDDQTIEISPKSDDKQSNHDYQSQRSITSTSIESNPDDQRDVRRHRPPQYSYNNQRSYNSGSSSKYGSKQKRGDNPDLRSRLHEQNNPKSSRSTYKTNH